MHTVRSRGDGNVPPVVDENSRSCPAHGFDRSNGECEQGAVSHVALANLHQVRTGLRRTAHRTVTELKDFRVPTLLIAGGEDVVFPPFLASAIAAALPCGEAHLIPHAGHSPYFEEAATFNGLVEAFLARQR